MKNKKFDFSNLKLPIRKGDWVDADFRIFIACFTILGQYVEKELGKGKDYNGYRLHAVDGNDEKFIDLWLWYKAEKDKKWSINEEEIYDQKFNELMKLRRSLWT